MPEIHFSFSGWVNSALITEAYNIKSGEKVDVSKMDAKELINKIESGELAISLSDALDSCASSEVELFDYEES